MYTGITSAGADQSNIGFILVNQRTKQATYYSIAGAEEYSAMSSAQGVVQDLGYRSTFPLLLNISSQPTYFMALKDGAGLVKAYAMVNVQQYQIVATGPTVASCEKNYLDLMIQHGLITKEEVEQYSESGEVAEIRTAVLSGTSYYYVRLEGDSYYYVISAAESEEVVIIDVGDRVTVDYTGTEGSLRPAYKITRD
jgi:predicted regulator of Ras-like GTPase activity (Roadblock/LC7/MglB family)